MNNYKYYKDKYLYNKKLIGSSLIDNVIVELNTINYNTQNQNMITELYSFNNDNYDESNFILYRNIGRDRKYPNNNDNNFSFKNFSKKDEKFDYICNFDEEKSIRF